MILQSRGVFTKISLSSKERDKLVKLVETLPSLRDTLWQPHLHSVTVWCWGVMECFGGYYEEPLPLEDYERVHLAGEMVNITDRGVYWSALDKHTDFSIETPLVTLEELKGLEL